MPVTKCSEDNKPGYKWGDRGKCYTYEEGNKRSEEEAYLKMRQQAKAIEASKFRRSFVKEQYQEFLNYLSKKKRD